jgi:hypothetical protein
LGAALKAAAPATVATATGKKAVRFIEYLFQILEHYRWRSIVTRSNLLCVS